MVNRFSKCETAEEVVFQAIGAGSMCWERPRYAGAFDSTEAKLVGEEAIQRLKEINLNG